jgi:myosin-5
MHRLEGNLGVTEALLQTEKEQNASTLKLLSEAQLRIEDLIKKLEGADRKSDSLQDTITRSDSVLVRLPPPLLFFWLFQ